MLVVEQLGALHQPRFHSLPRLKVAVFLRILRTHLIFNVHDLVAQRVILNRVLPRSIQLIISRLIPFNFDFGFLRGVRLRFERYALEKLYRLVLLERGYRFWQKQAVIILIIFGGEIFQRFLLYRD